MKEDKIKNINKMGKISHIVAIVAKVLLSVGVIGIIVGLVALILVPGDLVTVDTTSVSEIGIDLSAVKESLKPGWVEEVKEVLDETEGAISVKEQDYLLTFQLDTPAVRFAKEEGIFFLMIAFVYVIVVLVIMIFLDKLCVALRDCKTPFEKNVVDKMQHFAYSLIIATAISIAGENFISNILGDADVSMQLDTGVLMIMLIVIALIYVFKYGTMLQKESDEML